MITPACTAGWATTPPLPASTVARPAPSLGTAPLPRRQAASCCCCPRRQLPQRLLAVLPAVAAVKRKATPDPLGPEAREVFDAVPITAAGTIIPTDSLQDLVASQERLLSHSQASSSGAGSESAASSGGHRRPVRRLTDALPSISRRRVSGSRSTAPLALITKEEYEGAAAPAEAVLPNSQQDSQSDSPRQQTPEPSGRQEPPKKKGRPRRLRAAQEPAPDGMLLEGWPHANSDGGEWTPGERTGASLGVAQQPVTAAAGFGQIMGTLTMAGDSVDGGNEASWAEATDAAGGVGVDVTDDSDPDAAWWPPDGVARDPQLAPGMRGLPRYRHLRVVHDEVYGAPPEGLTDARAVELTEATRHTASLAQLRDLLDAHGDVLNAINLTAFAVKLAALAAAPAGEAGGDGGQGGAEGTAELEVSLDEVDGRAGLPVGGMASLAVSLEDQLMALLGSLGPNDDEQGEGSAGKPSPSPRPAAAAALAKAPAVAAAPVAEAWAAGPDALALTDQLAAQLGDIVQQRILDMDPEGVVTLLFSYAKMGRRHEVLPDLVFAAGQNMEVYHSQAVSNLVWALARLQPDSSSWTDRSWWEGLFLCTQDRLKTYPPQALSTIIWALGCLRVRPPASWQRDLFAAATARLFDFSSQGVATFVQGAAKLNLRLSTSLQEKLMRYGASNLWVFSNQGLVVYLWGLSKSLAEAPEGKHGQQFVPGMLSVSASWAVHPWLEEAMLPELVRRMPSLDCRQLAILLYSLGQLRFRLLKGPWLRAYWAAVEGMLGGGGSGGSGSPGGSGGGGSVVGSSAGAPRHPGGDVTCTADWDLSRRLQGAADGRGSGNGCCCDAVSLTNMLKGAADLRLTLPTHLLPLFWQRSKVLLPSYSPTALSSTGWSLCRSKLRPPLDWLELFQECCRVSMPRMSPTELPTLLYSLSRVVPERVPDMEWLLLSEAEWLQGLDRCQPVDLFRGLAAYARWRYQPGRNWQAAMQRQLAAKLPEMSSFQLPQMVWYLADVGAPVSARLLDEMVEGAVAERVLGAVDLAQLVCGLAKLQREVKPPLLAALLEELLLLGLDPSGSPAPTGRAAVAAWNVLGLRLLVDTVWAFAALRYTPADPWLADTMVALARGLHTLNLPQMLQMLTVAQWLGPARGPQLQPWRDAAALRLRALEAEELDLVGVADGGAGGLPLWTGAKPGSGGLSRGEREEGALGLEPGLENGRGVPEAGLELFSSRVPPRWRALADACQTLRELDAAAAARAEAAPPKPPLPRLNAAAASDAQSSVSASDGRTAMGVVGPAAAPPPVALATAALAASKAAMAAGPGPVLARPLRRVAAAEGAEKVVSPAAGRPTTTAAAARVSGDEGRTMRSGSAGAARPPPPKRSAVQETAGAEGPARGTKARGGSRTAAAAQRTPTRGSTARARGDASRHGAISSDRAEGAAGNAKGKEKFLQPKFGHARSRRLLGGKGRACE